MEYLNYLHNNNVVDVVRLFTAGSDFILKGRKRSAFLNFFGNRVPKVCSVIHKTFFSYCWYVVLVN